MGDNRGLTEEIRDLREQIEEEKAAQKERELAYKRDCKEEYRRRLEELQGKDSITEMDIEKIINLKVLSSNHDDIEMDADNLESIVRNMIDKALADSEIQALIDRNIESKINEKSRLIVSTFNQPNSQLMTIDKISESIRREMLEYNAQYQVAMEKRGSKKQIDTIVTLTRKDLDDLSLLPPNINEDDMRTLNSLMTFYVLGEEKVSLNQLYRVKIRDNKANPNKRQTESLKKQLRKLNQTYIIIDCSQEAKNYNYENLMKSYEGHMISVDIFTGVIRGNETTTIQINSISPLFKYALNKKQYIEIPFEVSDNNLSRTSRNLALEEYLYKRIRQMDNSNNRLKNNCILSDTIISNLNMEKSNKTTIARLYQDIEEVLKAFVLNGFITNYKPVKKGRRLYYKWEISI